ncbi:MAG: hypothetical protein E6K13_04330 [Methanobacteriota archaeon]|nr:MAG: hypothetical protein E6K13_04330 [Euryarchaeota archaeon]
MSLAVERQRKIAWIRRDVRGGLRGLLAWAVMVLFGVIVVSPFVASATSAPAFTLGGTAFRAQDPTNAANFAISMDTSAADSFGFATRTMSVPIGSLTGFLSLDYYLAGRDCGGGSPRISLGVDITGDGVRDGNAFGYVGPAPSFVSCTPNLWQSADLTDSGSHWDLTQFGGPFYNTWGQAITFFASEPFRTVVRASLVDDSAWLSSAAGLAYYDNVVLGDEVLSGPGDVITSDAPVHLDEGSDNVIDLDFTTIQAAVNGAAAIGDTVLVDPGTYPELVVIAKSVTLKGAQAGISGCGRSSASESIVGTSNGAFQILANNVVIDGFTITGVDGSSGVSSLGAGIWTAGTNSGHIIRNNIITGNTIGIYLNSDGSFPSTVEHNLFDSNNVAGAASGNGIYSDLGANSLTIDNNCFTGQLNAAMVFAGGSPGSGNTQNGIDVSGNEFVDDAGGAVFFFTTGLTLTANSWRDSFGTSVFLGGGVHDVAISENTFDSADFRGIRILAGAIGVDTELDTGVTVNFNNLLANAAEGLRVDTASYSGALDATCNWWGDPSGPTVATNPSGMGDDIFDADATHVTFVPWLSTAIPNPCSGPVHLDIGSDSIIDVNFGIIQPAVTTGGDGDTVLVDPGLYVEQVVVDAGIDVRATTPGTATIRAPAPGSRTTFTIPSSGRAWDAIVQVKADDATIEGFVIDGFGRGGCSALFTGIMMHGGLDMIARDNLVTGVKDTPFAGCEGVGIAVYPDTSGVPATAEISGNTIIDYSKGGIVVNNDGALANVHDNVVTGIGPTGVIAQNGIQFGFGGEGRASGNTVSGNWYSACGDYLTCFNAAGILVVESSGVQVEDNTLSGNQAGINLFATNAVDIQENVISGSAWAIIVDSSDSVTVEENTIGVPTVMSNAVQAIGIWALASNDVSVAENSIDFGGAVPAVGTLEGISFRDSSGSVVHNTVRSVRMASSNFGIQTGLGIAVGGAGVVSISRNSISDYQKGGIVVGRIGDGLRNDNIAATIDHNSVIGVGVTSLIAQNGIQVADGTVAEVKGNEVSGNWYGPCGDYLTCFNAAGILVIEANAVLVRGNSLADNQAGVNLFHADDAQIRENTIKRSAWAVIVDTSDGVRVEENEIGRPSVLSGAKQIIGIWVIGSTDAFVARNSINFRGNVGAVETLNGIRFDDSSGAIVGNSVRRVRMAGSDFSLRTGIGIAARGTGDLRIEENVVKDYQLGGIFVGSPDSSFVGHVDILKNVVQGVGPTRQIAQIGVFVSGSGVTGSIKRNSISDNCFSGSARRGDDRHDDDDREGRDDDDHHDDDHHDDDHGKARCNGEFEVKKADRKTCPPPDVAFGLLLCNVPKDAVQVSKNKFKGNQVDIFRVRP